MAKRFELVFRVGVQNSGRATFLAKIYGGLSSPYQRPIGDDRCEQEFVFTSFKSLMNFFKFAYEEFDGDFEVMHLVIVKE
jgi:hypothetical protein